MARRDEPGLASTPGDEAKARERGLSAHILPTSATMIGVCMTVLSIGHLGPRGELRVIVDKLLAVDALLFLVSAVLSFMSLRPGHARQRYEWRRAGVHLLARHAGAGRGGAGLSGELNFTLG